MKTKLIYTVILVTFLLMGVVSLAIGETSDQNNTSISVANDTANNTTANNTANISMPVANTTAPNGIFEATVDNVLSTDSTNSGGNNSSMASLTLTYPEGNTEDIGFVQITLGSQEANIYNTLNSAYLNEKHVEVAINNDSNGNAVITSVWYAPKTGFSFKL